MRKWCVRYIFFDDVQHVFSSKAHVGRRWKGGKTHNENERDNNNNNCYCYLIIRNAEASLVEIASRDQHYKRIFLFLLTHGCRECNPGPFCQSRDFGIEFA